MLKIEIKKSIHMSKKPIQQLDQHLFISTSFFVVLSLALVDLHHACFLIKQIIGHA